MEKWSSKYSVKVPVIDNQHKEIFRLIEELTEAVKQNIEIDKSYTIARLEVYSLYHFTTEEHLMKKYNYPETEDHLKEHKKFRVEILRFKNVFLESKDEEGKIAEKIIDYLEDWINSHILVTDKKYSPYLSG